MRFREFELNFNVSEQEDTVNLIKADDRDDKTLYQYPKMSKTLGPFKLSVDAGKFKPSECMMMLGQNGTGKTTFIKMLAGILKPDEEEWIEMPKLSISYKPQTITPKF